MSEKILPIISYGNPVLRVACKDVEVEGNEELQTLIDDMWATMYKANGVGLAAPQVGIKKRIFIVDTEQIFKDMDPEDKKEYEGQSGIKEVFINAQVLETDGEPYAYNEGCLSLPGIREDVMRDEWVEIEYYDADNNKQLKKFDGINARVILHEYDHIEGKLFIDYLKPLKKKMLQKRLNNISKGRVDVPYKMKFAK